MRPTRMFAGMAMLIEGGGTLLAFIVSTNVALDIDRLSLSFHCFFSAIVDDTRPL
jgi:hypothetical protein